MSSDGKTRFCEHDGPCFHSAARLAARNFAVAYGGKAGLSLALAAMAGRLRRPGVVQAAVGSDPARFGLFVALVSGGFRATLCGLRRLRGCDDGFNAAVAGGVSGLALLADSRSRRADIALYLLGRAVAQAWVGLSKRGIVPVVPHGDTLAFCLVCSVIMTAFTLEPDVLSGSYVRFIEKFASNHINRRLRVYYLTHQVLPAEVAGDAT